MGSAQRGAARVGPGQVLLIYTLSLSTNYISGPISGAGKTVHKTGLCCLSEVAQGRGDNEKTNGDLQHNYCVYRKMVICNFHRHLALLEKRMVNIWNMQKHNLKSLKA